MYWVTAQARLDLRPVLNGLRARAKIGLHFAVAIESDFDLPGRQLVQAPKQGEGVVVNPDRH